MTILYLMIFFNALIINFELVVINTQDNIDEACH
jgi:hypothetical protein